MKEKRIWIYLDLEVDPIKVAAFTEKPAAVKFANKQGLGDLDGSGKLLSRKLKKGK